MARMIPPYISDEVKSSGEKQVFEYFKNDPDTKEWIILHSLALSKHIKRLYGEIDFFVLAPGLGIFCLEVKSGDVKRKEGIWTFTNRFGEENSKPYGPFQQAQEAMFSLKGAIKERFGEESFMSRLLFGYGVMFPHILYQVQGVDEEEWRIYDRDSRRFPVSQYIKQLAKHEKKKVEHCQWFDKAKSIPQKAEVNQLVAFLRGDFERLVTPQQRLWDTEEQITHYTEEQFHCLDQLQDNPRCLFQGAAGTGKTMIALESARRSLFADKHTLLVCFNVRLGNWLAHQLKSNKNLVVSSFHRFLMQLQSISQRENPPENESGNEEYFKYDLPLLALEAIDHRAIEPFDKIIIDEGQDLIREEYLDVFDASVKGGLAGGIWEMYCDFERQAIYSEITAAEMLKMLNSRTNFAKFRLKINCRNTKPIGEETALLCGFEEPPFLPSKIEGIPVDYYFYDNPEKEGQKLETILCKLIEQNIQSDEITILSPYKYENSCASSIHSRGFHVNSVPENLSSTSRSKPVHFCTIHGFKGLESSYVILVDIAKIDDDEFRSLLYVGMSRAKVGLSVLLDKRAEKDYQRLIRKRLTAL